MLSVLYFDETKPVFTNRSAENIFVMKLVISCLKDDEDGHLVVLTIIEELMSKRQEEFLDHFARLGVFSKVQLLMGSGGEPDIDVIKSQEDASCSRSAKGMTKLAFKLQFKLSNIFFRAATIAIRATGRCKRNIAW